MKTNTPDDAPLRALLQEWNPQPPLPARFQERVWRRIEHAETAAAPSVSLARLFANCIGTMLPRPALATAYVAVLLAVGAGLGWSQARQESVRIAGSLSARYVQAVDPYQANLQP